MKNLFKKFISYFFTFILIFNISTIKPSALSLSQNNLDLDSKYNLKTISLDDVPENVIPLVFDSIEEADLFLSKIHNTNINLGITNTSTSERMFRTFGHQTKAVKTAIFGNYEISVNYEYSGHFFLSCSSVVGTYVGITLGNVFNQTSSHYEFIDGGRTLDAYVYGVMDHYLIIQGLVKLSSSDINLHGEFYLE